MVDTMVVLIVMPDRWYDAVQLRDNLRRFDPTLDVRIWPDGGAADEVEVVVCWRHPGGLMRGFPNLRLVVSFGAGVEHLMSDEQLPDCVPIVRTVDPTLIADMVGYVTTAINHYHRLFATYRADQASHTWRPRPYGRNLSALVLGMGRLGSAAAAALVELGFQVTGWSRSDGPASDDVNRIAGRVELDRALGTADSVTCLLPLTNETKDLLDARFFSMMKRGSLLVNVGRGGHVVEQDLVDALAADRPAHAVLDVFREEPLPEDHPFWDHPKVTMTPHVAALTDPLAAAERVADCCRRLRAGEPLLDRVDLTRGY